MMNLVVTCLLSIVLCLAAEFSSAQRKNGRHTGNIDLNGVGYNYRGNRWNTNVRHNWNRGHTSLNANYQRKSHNHGFKVGHNWRNRQTNFGYEWKWGKRRLGTDTQQRMLDFLKMESKPNVFLRKLQTIVSMFVKTHQSTVPELDILSVSIPDDQISNVTVAEELVCLIKKLQIILPKSLGNFIVKMIKFHGPSYDIHGLSDFFSVDPDQKYEIGNGVDRKKATCEVPEVPLRSRLVNNRQLLEMKKFVATLITVAMEYQQMLE